MKKSFALVVLSCAVMISSTTSASVIENSFLATNNRAMLKEPTDEKFTRFPEQ